MQELHLKNFDFDNDLLICTGDIIDRGTENLECISLLDQKWFLTVRGNHEEMCIRGQHDPKMKDMHARNGGAWFYRQFQKTRQRIIGRLAKLPLVIEVELKDKKIGIVHADIDIHDWNAFKEDLVKGDYKISGITSAYTNALWGRGEYVITQINMILSKILMKFILVIQLSKSRHKSTIVTILM
jgi:serine/threonine protein phosphatase 1